MPIELSNYEACIARIAARGSIGQREAENLLELVSDESERLKAKGTQNPVAAAAWSLAQDLKAAATEKQADALRNAGIRTERIASATIGGTDINGAMAKLHGTLYWMPGTDPKLNVQTLSRSLTDRWLSVMHAALDKAGLVKVAADPAMFREISVELDKLRSGEATIEMPTNHPARQIANIVFELQEAMRTRLNAEGARIADAKDWIATTSHDAYLLQRGGRGQPPAANFAEALQRWRDFVQDKLDPKTFDDVRPRTDNDGNAMETQAEANQRFLDRTFRALYDGVHLRTGSDVPATVGPNFEGTYNIARKLSQGRSLFWKDGGAWADYMQQYGQQRDWYGLMTQRAVQDGRRAALMNIWGTNPAGNLNLAMQRIEQMFHDTDPDGVIRFQQQQHSYSVAQIDIDHVMQALDGRASVPANEFAARFMSGVRSYMNMVYLGAVAITHAASLITTFPSEARFYGINTFSALGRLMGSMVPEALKAGDRAEVLAQMGAYADGVSREAMDYFSHGWNMPGLVANMQNRFMKAGGLPYVFDHAKAGMKEMIANKMARDVTTPFEQLEPHLQNMLRSYGINAEDWTLLKGGQLSESAGRSYLTPQTPTTLDSSAIEGLLRARGTIGDRISADNLDRAIAGYRSHMTDRIAMLLQDAADHSVVTPGVRERAIVQRGMAPGSWSSELVHSLLQFKTWPLAATHQVIGREVYQSLSRGDAAWGIGTVAALTMIGGYMRITARDLAYGDQPRTPQNVGDAAELALHSLAQGGGFGLVADALFGDLNRLGASHGASFFGGPIGTTVSQVSEIYNNYLHSIRDPNAKYDVWPEIGRFALGKIPFANLFWLKAGMDYLLFYHLFEGMKPGWWQRSNERMQKEQGRTHMGYKPYAPVPYTPWG